MYYMLNAVIQQIVWVSEPGMEVLNVRPGSEKHRMGKITNFLH